jgi:hypothetical protein
VNVFFGFDTSHYPGDEMMALLCREARMSWTGFYLAPAPSHGDESWMQKRAFLSSLGLGFAPVYVGQQQSGPGSHILTGAQGAIDGENATELAIEADFPAGSVLYLDIETGPPVEPAFLTYYKTWVQAVIDAGYSPGVYCSHLLADQFIAQDDRAIPWVFQVQTMGGNLTLPLPAPDPSQSTFAGARLLQFAQNCTVTIETTSIGPVDLDTALMPDPSAPNPRPGG